MTTRQLYVELLCVIGLSPFISVSYKLCGDLRSLRTSRRHRLFPSPHHSVGSFLRPPTSVVSCLLHGCKSRCHLLIGTTNPPESGPNIHIQRSQVPVLLSAQHLAIWRFRWNVGYARNFPFLPRHQRKSGREEDVQ